MRKTVIFLALALLMAMPAQAHFGLLIPSADTVNDRSGATLQLNLAFAHPMEQSGMDLARPKAFLVVHDGTQEDLKPRLKAATLMGHKAWTASYAVSRPGVYQFVMEPEPYFEPAEDSFIIHYTKTAVAAFGEEEGWDAPLGLKTEIVPLSRPFANYSGNIFQGRVLLDGKPVPNCAVEIENYNIGKKHAAPNDYFVTQVTRTDANGVFAYAVPWAGWWGFAALNSAAEKIKHNGTDKNVELGAVLWVNFTAPIDGEGK